MHLAHLLVAFFLLLPPAWAKDCESGFGLFEKRPQKVNTRLGERSGYPTKMSGRKIRKFNEALRQEIDRIGIGFVPSKQKPSIFDVRGNDDLSKNRIPTNVFQVLEVESVRGSGKAPSVSLPAWEHPEMAAKLADMRARGYTLNLDPSLDLNAGGGAGAFFRPDTKSITLGLKSPWHVFLHELEHLEFDHQVLGKMKELGFSREYEEFISKKVPIFEYLAAQKKAAALGERAFSEFMSYLETLPGFQLAEDSLSAKAMKIYRTIPTKLGVNETLATQKALDELAKEGLTLADSRVLSEKMYQLEHQIQALESVRRTPAQEEVYQKLVASYRGMQATCRGMYATPLYRKGLEFIGKYGWPGVGLMAYLAYNKKSGKEELVVTDGKKALSLETGN